MTKTAARIAYMHAPVKTPWPPLLPLLTVLLLSYACSPTGTHYSDDLNDILPTVPSALPMSLSAPTPIGDLGPIEVVVDLRGFVPLSLLSKHLMGMDLKTISEGLRKPISEGGIVPDDHRWYKIPTKTALLLIYYGALKSTDLKDKLTAEMDERYFKKTRIITESEAKGEMALWCKLAYDIAKESDPLIKKMVGEYDVVEPILLWFTKNDVFVVLSTRYTTLFRHGTGQVMIAMNFSRTFKTYKTVYPLYSTMMMTESLRKDLIEAAPYAAKIAAQIFLP